MNLSLPFIKRPIATSLLAFGVVFSGLISFYFLPVASLPQIDFPTIKVSAGLPGASPEIMGSSVAMPLERQLGHIAGVTSMTSTSTLGQTTIIVQFDLNRDINGACRDVQAAINAARSQLPPNLPNNPIYFKINPADAPILILTLTSDKYPLRDMFNYASTVLQQKIAQSPGIGQVFVAGSALPGVRIELNPTALNAYGIGLDEVASTIAEANQNLPKGQITLNDNTLSTLQTNDQLFKAHEYSPLIITYKNNAPVRIADVGYAVDSVEDLRNIGITNGKRSVILLVYKQPGANIIQTVNNLKAQMPLFRSYIPQGINLSLFMDRTLTIRTALHDVEFTLLLSMILVILVTYLYIGSIRAMVITGVAVPLSLLGTFSILKLGHYTLDNLSLMALTVSTGFVVDDAVVVVENIARHIESGVKPLQAAIDGAREIGFTVISMSLSLIAVFIPILFMGGIVGRLFFEFAITMAVAVLISMVVSLTVTPVMCATVLKTGELTHHGKWQQLLDSIHRYYAKSLGWALNRSTGMLCLAITTVIVAICLFVYIPKGFFPQQDTGRITGTILADQDISFQSMEKVLREYIALVQQDPAVEGVSGVTGANGPSGNTANTGSLFINLKPLSQRGISADGVVNRLRHKLNKVPGGTLYLQAAQDLLVGGRAGNGQYQYTITADSLEHLNKWAPRIQQEIKKLHGIVDLSSDQLNHGLQTYVTIDHDTASRFGITPLQIDSTLYDAFGQKQVSTLLTNMNQYHVVMEVAPEYWQYPATLKQIYVDTPTNTDVPLATFTRFDARTTLLSVNHQSLAPSVTLSFNLLPGIALGDVVDKITHHVSKMLLPHDIQGSFQGNAQAFQASLANEKMLILTALLVVYVVLGMLYESLVHPITILLTIPSAGVGALLALLLTHTDFSIIALIGIILLIGIVKKNAIMMIDFALEVKQLENKTSKEAIYEAAVMRFRPIMMTTMAALLGAMPLVIGFGLGAELRRPLGIVIVGGLIFSQILTLYTTPVVFLTMEKISLFVQSITSDIRLRLKPVQGS